MKSLRVGNLIGRFLKMAGVNVIFGIPGTQSLECFDSLAEEGVDIVLPTSEFSASFMADGFSRASGKVGVLLLIPGPGLTYALTGIGEALLDNVPLLILATDIHKDIPFSFQLHEIDQVSLSTPLSKRVFKIERPSESIPIIKKAFETALGPPGGPVVVNIPSEFYGEKVEGSIVPPEITLPRLNRETLKKIALMITEAKNPGILAGWGCMDSYEELIKFAEHINAPLATTISGRGVIPEDHPLSTGYGFGPSGTYVSEEIFKRVDLLIAIGVRFSEVGTGTFGLPKIPRVIHIDADERVAGRNISADFFAVADAGEFLKGIISFVPPRKNERIMDLIRNLKEKENMRKMSQKMSKEGVDPGYLVRACRELYPRDTIVTTDAGAHTFWVLEHFPVYCPRTFLCPVDFQAMGYSIPAAIGASIAQPSKTVLCTVGDGAFLYTGFEILFASEKKCNIKFLVFSDGYLGLIREIQNKIFKREVSVKLNFPDLKKLAESFNIPYIPITSNEEVPGSIAYSLSINGPVLIDARVSYERMTKFIQGALKTHLKRIPLSKKIEGLKIIIKRF